MCAIVTAILMLLGGLFSYSVVAYETSSPPQIAHEIATPAAIPTEAISCESQSSDQDIQDMLALVGDTFSSSSTWTKQVATYPSSTTMTWLSNSLGAVAYLEYLHFDCGVTQAQIDAHFNAAAFQTLFTNYTSYHQTAACHAGGLELFEFDVVTTYNSDDHALFWVEQASPTRVADLLLVMPDSEKSQQAEYAGRLFPALPTCQAAAG